MKLFEITALCVFCGISSALAVSSPFQEVEYRHDFPRTQHYSDRPEKRIHRSHFNYYEGQPTITFDRTLTNRRNDRGRYQYSSGRDRPRENYYNSSRNRNQELVSSGDPGTVILRTYGRGKAEVTRQGDTVYVPNEIKRRAHKGSISVRVVNKEENEVKTGRQRGGCKECPTDQTVVATKRTDFVILPEPCATNPKMWNHHSGPRPGSKVREGLHTITGTLGHKKKYCQYRYQVLVQYCQPLKPKDEDTIIECSAGHLWGSICTLSCGPDKELVGASDMECLENLTWSNPLPVCKSKLDCSTPKVKTNSKISCHTANMTQVEGDYLPNGSTCRFKKNGRVVSINCKNGTWRIHRKMGMPKNKKQNVPENKENVCNPNPCQNGGTCLKPESKGSPICLCRPQTQGPHCEMRECDYNHCQNDGLCFFQNDERTCYCTAEYNGDRCQYYTAF